MQKEDEIHVRELTKLIDCVIAKYAHDSIMMDYDIVETNCLMNIITSAFLSSMSNILRGICYASEDETISKQTNELLQSILKAVKELEFITLVEQIQKRTDLQ